MKATKEHFEYLDDLRESSATNMFGAPRYLVEDFGLSKKDANAIFWEWANQFGKDKNATAT